MESLIKLMWSIIINSLNKNFILFFDRFKLHTESSLIHIYKNQIAQFLSEFIERLIQFIFDKNISICD